MLVVSPFMSAVARNDREGHLNNLVLARSTINRASDVRPDGAKLEELWHQAKILIMVGDRICASDTELIFCSSVEIPDSVGERYFLGLDPDDGQSYFSWHTVEEVVGEDQLRTLRQVGAFLSDFEAGLAVHAIALGHWHRTHPRCSKCGASTRVDLGGAVRVCDVDASQHHPRTDPAVIVLVKDKDDRILLGHQATWPPGRFSNLAGFVEPGESFEQCVVREVEEESGIVVHSIHYLGSQPWPFPASIMVAFEAITSDVSTARPDGEEITEIQWFSREEMKVAVQAGSLLLPPRISVARQMIEFWYGADAVADLIEVGSFHAG
ncbi:MAG TPA: NAD(+) diphosphatase [Candidatus Nanopelagicaceae bacterium]